MTQTQNQALGDTCLRLAKAAKDALAWLKDNEKLVGTAYEGIERSLKRHVVEARRLAEAANRPMSVAVFGPSQAGKSFLIGKFITPVPEQHAKVVFEDEKLDFLGQVNPQGGKETTGLVTRFTTKPLSNSPKGFPVVLRLLREVDIVKILINTFVLDLSAEYDTTKFKITAQSVDEAINGLASKAGKDEIAGFCLEDVFELRQYLEGNLRTHPWVTNKSVAEAYWTKMERLLPFLQANDRTQALSLLWGQLAEFDALFMDLKSALDQLEHSPEVFAQIESIRDTSAGVLHVDRIYELSQATGPGSQTIKLALNSEKQITLRKSIVTALTAELRVSLDLTPWPFLAHTDLLDFPGARSREGSSPEKYLKRTYKAGSEKPPREHCFLRGKVAVLFDNYVADLELNAMLLCVPDSNLEVRTLPGLIEEWVYKTHGETPEEREKRITSLLFCMTKCDRLFDLAAGAGLDKQIENRFTTNFDEFPGWTRTWHPNKTFKNTFMLRNPKAIEQPAVFSYKGAPADRTVRDEETYTPDFEKRLLPAFRDALKKEPKVTAYVDDLEKKIEALMSFNDGGVMYLAKALGPVCDPNLKQQQIRPLAEALSVKLRATLGGYYDEDDIKVRVDQRLKRAIEALKVLVSAGIRNFGLVIQSLGVEESTLCQAYFDYARRDNQERNAEGEAQNDVVHNDFGIDLDALAGEPKPKTETVKKQARKTFGACAVARWLDTLMRRAGDTSLKGRLGMGAEQFQVFVDEMRAGANRLGIVDKIDDHASRAIDYKQSLNATSAAVALGASHMINDFIADAGRRLMENDADPDRAAAARKAFTPPPQLSPGQIVVLPEDEKSLTALRQRYPVEWVKAFQTFVRENASSSSGRLVDVEQNARLGDILRNSAM